MVTPKVLIITGMSGAGRSSAAAVFEDLGYFVIDNLPPELIKRLGDFVKGSTSVKGNVALVLGRGGSEAPNYSEIKNAIASLRSEIPNVTLLFLDAPDDILIRRYESSRRRHPVDSPSVMSSIAAERASLKEIRSVADIVIDTGNLNVHEFREKLVKYFGDTKIEGPKVSVISFGFANGIPLDADMVFDVRFLPNPHWEENLRAHTGLEPEVREYVLTNNTTQEFLRKVKELLDVVIPGFIKEGKSYISIAIGCTGGKHRSVVIASEVANMLKTSFVNVNLINRDIEK